MNTGQVKKERCVTISIQVHPRGRLWIYQCLPFHLASDSARVIRMNNQEDGKKT
jgi:hypothetical protein